MKHPRLAITVAVVAALYIAIAAVLFLYQRALVFAPDRAVPDAQAIGIPTLRTLTLTTRSGLNLLAWYVPARQGRPTLAYFHGNGGNLADRRDRLRLFAAAGLGVLMPDYPGYGGNPGAPSQTGFDEAGSAAMDYLQDQKIDPHRIVVYGESIGTAVATRAAAGRSLGGLVLESPFTSVTDIAQRRFFFLPVGLLIRDPFDQLAWIGRLRCPLLVLQGARDTVVPPVLGRRLYDAAPQPKTLWVAPDAGHANLFAHGAVAVVIAFVGQAAQ